MVRVPLAHPARLAVENGDVIVVTDDVVRNVVVGVVVVDRVEVDLADVNRLAVVTTSTSCLVNNLTANVSNLDCTFPFLPVLAVLTSARIGEARVVTFMAAACRSS